MPEPTFKFEMNQEVQLTKSGEQGTIIGRADHANCENSYRICYRAADGRQVTDWWEESLIQPTA